MGRSRSSRSGVMKDEIDLVYKIDMPFEGTSAEIILINNDGHVEIIIASIPVPSGYHQNYKHQREDSDEIKEHAVARWIVDDAASALDPYDWSVSSSRSNSGNYYLRDIYFTCQIDQVDDAVISAKVFLTQLEESAYQHSRHFGNGPYESPSEKLNSLD